jgi:hypothetical protein
MGARARQRPDADRPDVPSGLGSGGDVVSRPRAAHRCRERRGAPTPWSDRGTDVPSIDANIAAAQIDAGVGKALLGRHFVVGRGSEPCPSATVQRPH